MIEQLMSDLHSLSCVVAPDRSEHATWVALIQAINVIEEYRSWSDVATIQRNVWYRLHNVSPASKHYEAVRRIRVRVLYGQPASK